MLKKVMLFTLVFACLVSLFGCGSVDKNQAGGNEAKVEDGSTSAVSEEEGTVEIMWQQEVTEKFWEYPMEEFKKKYPYVEIEFDSNPKAYEAIRNRFASGDVPDIFYSWSSDFDYFGAISEGLVYPVDDILKEKTFENDAILNEKLFKPGLDLGEVDGKHYLLPITKLLASSYYSGKFFQDNNYTAPKTWDEFFELSETIKKDGKAIPVIYAGAYPFMLGDAVIFPSIMNIDEKAVDAINNNEPGAWKQPAVLTVMKRIQDMRDKGFIDKNSLAMDHIQSQIEFINNKASLVPSGTWLEGEMEGQWPEGFDLQPMLAPAEADGKTSVVSVIESMILPKKSDSNNLKYVTELVKLFYSKENVSRCIKNTGFLLATQDQDESNMSLLPKSSQTTWELVSAGNAKIVTPSFKLKFKDLFTEYNNNINALISGQINADQFCENMEKKARERDNK